MKGGISYISKRYIKINDIKSIMYWDANNLYGWAMNQYLSHGKFSFLTKKETDGFDLDSISKNSSLGYILEVDLKYCGKLYDLHNDCPSYPEKIEITQDMLSKYCSEIANKYGIKVGGVIKLVPNLKDIVKCIVPYRNLQHYLSLGIKLIKVHRILKFEQSNWLKGYIEFNTEKRTQTKDKFSQYLFNYSIIVCMENIWRILETESV